MFLGREWRVPGVMGTVFRKMDRARMEKFAREKLSELGLMTIQDITQPVETLSGGQRQGVAVELTGTEFDLLHLLARLLQQLRSQTLR